MAKGNRGGKRADSAPKETDRVSYQYQETLREATAYLELQGTNRYDFRRDFEVPVLTSAQRNAYTAISEAAERNEPTAKRYGKNTLEAALGQVRYDRAGHESKAFKGLEEDRASIDFHKKKRDQYARMEAMIRRSLGG